MIHKSISKTPLCIINEIDLVVDVVSYVLINCMPAGCTAYRGGVTNGGGAVAPGGQQTIWCKTSQKYFDTRNTKLSMIVDE